MSVTIHQGDALEVLRTLPAASVHCCVTSPPYWGLRDYGVPGQLGLEATPEAHVDRLVEVFREVRRVLRDDGTLWVNYGDSYNAYNGGAGPSSGIDQRRSGARPQLQTGFGLQCRSLKPKDLLGLPWMLAFALRADGWYLRSEIIWHKPNPMPESVTDRPTKSHEQVFLLSKAARYFYDADAVREDALVGGHRRVNSVKTPHVPPGKSEHRGLRIADGYPVENGRNLRSVWTIPTAPFPSAHFATFPPALVEPCIKAGTSERGCCATCGAPWVREVERVSTGKSYAVGKSEAKRKAGLATGFSGYDDGSSSPVFRTTGFRPTCDHGGDPVPCVVLDPFAGAGTTGLVADRLGRGAVLIELNPEYVALARRRLVDDCPLFAKVEVTT